MNMNKKIFISLLLSFCLLFLSNQVVFGKVIEPSAEAVAVWKETGANMCISLKNTKDDPKEGEKPGDIRNSDHSVVGYA